MFYPLVQALGPKPGRWSLPQHRYRSVWATPGPTEKRMTKRNSQSTGASTNSSIQHTSNKGLLCGGHCVGVGDGVKQLSSRGSYPMGEADNK